MRKQKMWFYSVYVNGKRIRHMPIPDNATESEEAEIRSVAEMIAHRYGGKVTKGFTLK